MFGGRKDKGKKNRRNYNFTFTLEEKNYLKDKFDFNDQEITTLQTYLTRVEYYKHTDAAIFNKGFYISHLADDIKRLFLNKGYYFDDLNSTINNCKMNAQSFVSFAKRDTLKSRYERLEAFIQKEIAVYKQSRSMHEQRKELLVQLDTKIDELKKHNDYYALVKFVKDLGNRAQNHHTSTSGYRLLGFLFNKKSRFKQMADRINQYAEEIDSTPMLLEPAPHSQSSSLPGQ